MPWLSPISQTRNLPEPCGKITLLEHRLSQVVDHVLALQEALFTLPGLPPTNTNTQTPVSPL